MRVANFVIVGFGLLSFLSCSDPRASQAPKLNEVQNLVSEPTNFNKVAEVSIPTPSEKSDREKNSAVDLKMDDAGKLNAIKHEIDAAKKEARRKTATLDLSLRNRKYDAIVNTSFGVIAKKWQCDKDEIAYIVTKPVDILLVELQEYRDGEEAKRTAQTSMPPGSGYSGGYVPSRATHIGPRGGVYHFSKSGHKVYHKRR